MRIRITAFFLSMLILFAAASGCAQQKTDPGDTTAAETAAIANTQTKPADNVPELDFGGSDFNILLRTHVSEEFKSEGETGEIVNDTVYRRNVKVEERFNIRFHMIDTAGTWGEQDNFLGKIRNSISAGDSSYDLIAGYAAYIANLTDGGYFFNWKDIPHIDYGASWWNQTLINDLTINGRLYFMTGDLALSTLENAVCLYFNKQIWAGYNFENPYEIVTKGEWTIDKMAEFTRQAYLDLDGDGNYSEGDQYGYVTDTHNLVDAYQAALDVPVTVTGEDGLPALNIQNEKFYSAFLKIYDLLRVQETTYTGIEQTGSPESLYRPFFAEGRALILPEYLGNSALMRDYDFDFGILPLPKYETAQKRYQTISQDGFSLFCIPSNIKNPEMVGAVTEVMAVETKNTVVPAFYDVALKNKYTRDDDSAAMIDIIRDGMIYNFNTVYAVTLGVPAHIWRILLINKKDNIASEIEKNLSQYQAKLDSLIELYNQ